MKFSIFLFTAFLSTLIFNDCTTHKPDHSVILYVGTFTGEGSEGLYKCRFDTLTGEIHQIELAEKMESPNFLTISKDRQFLYACVRPVQENNNLGAVRSYKINPSNGALTFLNQKPTSGADPCYIDITSDGKVIAVANYGGGNLTVFHTNDDGSLTEAVQSIEHEGSGPVMERQTKPHAHSIQFSPFDNQVFAADLGIDKLMCYQLDKSDGKLVEGEQPFVEIGSGAGPRHFDFHPDGNRIYVVNELNSTVTVLGKYENKYFVDQEISTLPEGSSGENYCADIHLSENAKFLYCSNRGNNSIATFSIADDGKLDFVGTTSVNGNWPRNFTFSPNKKFILVANQKSNNITVYKINPLNGLPVYTDISAELPSPVCLAFK